MLEEGVSQTGLMFKCFDHLHPPYTRHPCCYAYSRHLVLAHTHLNNSQVLLSFFLFIVSMSCACCYYLVPPLCVAYVLDLFFPPWRDFCLSVYMLEHCIHVSVSVSLYAPHHSWKKIVLLIYEQFPLDWPHFVSSKCGYPRWMDDNKRSIYIWFSGFVQLHFEFK